MKKPETYSLFELNEYVRRVIALNFPETIWITAEVHQVTRSRGHFYLELIQKSEGGEDILAQAGAVLWNTNRLFLERKMPQLLDQLLQEGQALRMRVQVEFSERYGFKLNIYDLDPDYTTGQVALQKQKILEQLSREGYLGLNGRLILPSIIKKIALVSSPHAAGLQDFLNHLSDNSYGYTFAVHLFEAAMQGKKTEREVLAALQNIQQRRKEFDLIVIVRGGGSKLDLSAFDSLILGKAIASSVLPVITGIGHDIDQTVADVVSHKALKTPTAVADFIVEHNLQFEQQIRTVFQSIQRSAHQHLRIATGHLENLSLRLENSIHRLLEHEKIQLLHTLQTLVSSLKLSLNKEKHLLDKIALEINHADPETILNRGYALVIKDRMRITSSRQLATGDHIITQFVDGKVTSTVNSTQS